MIEKWKRWECPNTPGFSNVIPDGPGWYRYERGLWRKWPFENANYDGQARYLTAAQLLDFALRQAQDAP